MSLIQGGSHKVNTTAFYPTAIDQSLRFEDGDNANLSRTISTTSNKKTYTLSAWVKLGNLPSASTTSEIFTAGTSAYVYIRLDGNDNLQIGYWTGSSHAYRLITTQVFRDPSAWYHIVVETDTTQATSSDRLKLYVNGVQVTSFSTSGYPALDYATTINTSGQTNYIGTNYAGSNDFDGYMAEVHFTDGTSYTADAFGELRSGIWVPKSPSVTYGTNGFKLTFEDSAAIGDDTSGNGNDWTVNNLVASDVVPDSPTNNFCTLNSVEFVNNSGFLSEGNLKISDTSSSNWTASGGTIGIKSGKWYWEAHLIVQENGFNIGVVKDTESATSGTWNYTKTNFYAISGIGTSYVSDGAGSRNAAGTSFAQGDTVQVAYDADTGKLYFGKNGTWLNSADPAAGTGNLETTSDPEYGYHPVTSTIGDASGYSDVIMNFGQDDTFAGNLTAVGNTDGNGIGSFKYTVPSGFLALCTANLPDPAIDPAQDATAEDYFTAVTYDGNGTSQDITVGFQPDFSWFKSRQAQSHILFDVIRGGSKYLKTDTTDAEATSTDLIAFTSDGLTLGHDGSAPSVNGTGPKVVWNWKADGTGVSNTDGSITSTVSANTDAGFSIVSFTAASASDTVGHGLNQKPEIFIIKNRQATYNWWTGIGGITGTDDDYLALNATSAKGNSGFAFRASDTLLTLSSNFTGGSGDHIAYCFHSVDGFSKVGSYIGNGSTDGAFIYTGFRPAFILQKRTDAAANWRMWDNRREGYNVDNDELKPNSNVAEGTQDRLDFLSNGFKWRDSNVVVNGSSGNYIYLAFAEQPFKYSNAR